MKKRNYPQAYKLKLRVDDMSLLQNILGKMRQKRQKFKELDEDNKINNLVSQRQKSSNERELEGYLEEKRQEQILDQVKKFRKQRQQDLMKTTVLGGKNMFANQPNIFANHQSTTMSGGNLFFK